MAGEHGTLNFSEMNYDADRPKAKNPVKIVDTTFRDAHQSSVATRMRNEDMEYMAEEMNKCGFYAMEVWGGATFDVPHRFLQEDPWERVRILKKLLPDTKLQMLLRGQNLVAYRNHPDDMVELFVEKAAEVGIDIFRVFDAVNDERNMSKSFEVIKRMGKHIQGAICYSLTERRLGGPVYNEEFFISKAKALVDMGADTFCIKDQAGLISPYDAYKLVKALKSEVDVPIELHTHYTSGQASMSVLKAIEAGVDIVDTCLSPWALRQSQPPIEPLLVALYGTDRDTGLDLKQIVKCTLMMEEITPKYRDFLAQPRTSVIDTEVLIHQIPGGMFSNLISQLQMNDALDRLGEVEEMTAKVREEMGFPPLVTPTSQIVGVQAVMNVLQGPYKMISREVKDYMYGLYGKSPAPIDKEVQKKCLEGYERGSTPITVRAADEIAPEMPGVLKKFADIAKDDYDYLICALFPVTGRQYLEWKYGKSDVMPGEPRITIEEVKAQDKLIAKAKAGELEEKKPPVPAPEKTAGARTFNVYVEDEFFEVTVDEVGGAPVVTSVVPAVAPAPAPAPAAAPAPAPAPAAPAVAAGETPIEAPMPGMVIRYEVAAGDSVSSGDTVVILEAMKMENSITTPVDGTVKSINFKEGDSVAKGDILVVIG